MKKLILCFITVTIVCLFNAQKLDHYTQDQLVNTSLKGGVPSSVLTIASDKLVADKVYSFIVEPGHAFSCFGIGWEMGNDSYASSLFIVKYRTKNLSGEWTRWNELTAEVTPNETPTGMFWTDAIFTDDATSHSAIEVILTHPSTPLSIKMNLFDGNYKTADNNDQSTKPELQNNEKSLDCPALPTMITRSQWCGGSASCSQVNAAYTPTYINASHVVIHHGATPNTYTSGQEIVQSYYNYHVNTLGWADIGYNYIVDKNGNFFQGRHNPNVSSSDVRGAHAGASNGVSIGINFPGNADVTIATSAQLNKVKQLLAWWFDKKGWDPTSSATMQTQDYGVVSKPRISGHKDIGQTSCPGNDLYSRIPNLRTSAKQIITDCNACGIPANLSASSITSTSATLNWTAAQNASSYTIQYKATSSTTWTTTTSTTNSKSVTGLSSNTSYDFKVMSTCSSGSSVYSTVKSFQTLAPSPVTLTLGTGTTAYSGHPYASSFMDELSQYIITKNELVAAGWTSQTPELRSIAFQVSTNSTTPLNSFTVKVSHTSASSYSGTNFLAGNTTVSTYTGTITTVNGWNTYTFPTPFNYNQTMNLVISVSFNNNTQGSNSVVLASVLPNYQALFRRENLSNGSISNLSPGTQSYYRPNMRLVFGASSAFTALSQSSSQNDMTINETTELKVFPNPMLSSNKLSFVTNLEISEESARIAIFDQLGRSVHQQDDIDLSSGQIDITTEKMLHPGTFFLKLENKNGSVIQKFLVIE